MTSNSQKGSTNKTIIWFSARICVCGIIRLLNSPSPIKEKSYPYSFGTTKKVGIGVRARLPGGGFIKLSKALKTRLKNTEAGFSQKENPRRFFLKSQRKRARKRSPLFQNLRSGWTRHAGSRGRSPRCGRHTKRKFQCLPLERTLGSQKFVRQALSGFHSLLEKPPQRHLQKTRRLFDPKLTICKSAYPKRLPGRSRSPARSSVARKTLFALGRFGGGRASSSRPYVARNRSFVCSPQKLPGNGWNLPLCLLTFAWGLVSPRQVCHSVLQNEPKDTNRGETSFSPKSDGGNFPYHLLYHFPRIPDSPLRLKYSAFPWPFLRKDSSQMANWTNRLPDGRCVRANSYETG